MMVEAYFDRPLLVKSFYPHNNRDYLFQHVHDMDLDFRAQRVIYLYRNPVQTVFSLSKYHEDEGLPVEVWATRYARHLGKWLLDEDFTQQKTVVRYEDLPNAVSLVAEHLGLEFDRQAFEAVTQRIDRQHTSQRSRHDPRAVPIQKGYAQERALFERQWGDRVLAAVLDERPELARFFDL